VSNPHQHYAAAERLLAEAEKELLRIEGQVGMQSVGDPSAKIAAAHVHAILATVAEAVHNHLATSQDQGTGPEPEEGRSAGWAASGRRTTASLRAG